MTGLLGVQEDLARLLCPVVTQPIDAEGSGDGVTAGARAKVSRLLLLVREGSAWSRGGKVKKGSRLGGDNLPSERALRFWTRRCLLCFAACFAGGRGLCRGTARSVTVRSHDGPAVMIQRYCRSCPAREKSISQ